MLRVFWTVQTLKGPQQLDGILLSTTPNGTCIVRQDDGKLAGVMAKDVKGSQWEDVKTLAQGGR